MWHIAEPNLKRNKHVIKFMQNLKGYLVYQIMFVIVLQGILPSYPLSVIVLPNKVEFSESVTNFTWNLKMNFIASI
jgi:small-conductance mechanosensitive channel